MTIKKRSSEILADEKTYFLGKITWKSVTCEIVFFSLKTFLMHAPDYLGLLLQSINQLFYFTKSINQSSNQITSKFKRQDPFLERKKVSRFLEVRKWSPYAKVIIYHCCNQAIPE